MKKTGAFILMLFVSTVSPAFSRQESVEKLFQEVQSAFRELTDYTCTLESYCSNGEASEKNVYEYYYKKPGHIRMRVESGRNRGAILLYNGDKVKVRAGKGMFSMVTMTFYPDNKRICDLRNHGINHSDWGWFIDMHIRDLGLFDVKFVGEESRDGMNLLVYELASKHYEKTDNIKLERLWIDKDRKIIIKYNLYDSTGALVQSSNYTDIVINSGLKDDIFYNFK